MVHIIHIGSLTWHVELGHIPVKSVTVQVHEDSPTFQVGSFDQSGPKWAGKSEV